MSSRGTSVARSDQPGRCFRTRLSGSTTLCPRRRDLEIDIAVLVEALERFGASTVMATTAKRRAVQTAPMVLTGRQLPTESVVVAVSVDIGRRGWTTFAGMWLRQRVRHAGAHGIDQNSAGS